MIFSPLLRLASAAVVSHGAVVIAGTVANSTHRAPLGAPSLRSLQLRASRRQPTDTQAVIAAARLATHGWGAFRISTQRLCLNDAGVECRPFATDTLPIAMRLALRQVLGPCPPADEESALIAVSRVVLVGNDALVLVQISTRAEASGPDRSVFGETIAAQYQVTVHIADHGRGAATKGGEYFGDGPGGRLAERHIPADATRTDSARPR